MAVDRRSDGVGGGPAEAGLAHLRAAAREAIEAGRALLDAAESALDDPELGRQLADSLRAVAEMAATLRPDLRHWAPPAPPGPDAAASAGAATDDRVEGAAPRGGAATKGPATEGPATEGPATEGPATEARAGARSGRTRRPAPRVTRIEVG